MRWLSQARLRGTCAGYERGIFGPKSALVGAEVTPMKRFAGSLALGFLCLSPALLRADSLNVLGTASGFAVLGGSAVTNTGASVLGGDLGVAPGSSATGFAQGAVTGVNHGDDGVAVQAHEDASAGYRALAALPFTGSLTGQDLGGLQLTPGVYFFASSAQLTGALTLDFGGQSEQSFVFQAGSTLTTASGSVVNVINRGVDDSVYWEIGSSATLGTGSVFQGYLVADQSISLMTGATIQCGSALALHGAVTLDTNVVDTCGADEGTGSGTPGTESGAIAQTPEPGTLGLLATGVLGAAGGVRRRWIA